MDLITAINNQMAAEIENIISEAEEILKNCGVHCDTNYGNMPYFYEISYVNGVSSQSNNRDMTEDFKKRMMENPNDEELDNYIKEDKEKRLNESQVKMEPDYYDNDMNADVYIMDNKDLHA